jgi:hypothetical protein
LRSSHREVEQDGREFGARRGEALRRAGRSSDVAHLDRLRENVLVKLPAPSGDAEARDIELLHPHMLGTPHSQRMMLFM